jgi:hypothetical protein
MALSIQVGDFLADGITLIPSTRDDFDALARPLIGRAAEIGLQLKPLLFIVSNESERTVVAFSRTWTVRHEDGRTYTERGQTSFPEYVCGDVSISHNPQALPPGGRRVESPHVVIQGYGGSDPYFDQFLHQFVIQNERMFADATELRIDLDAVIFADGQLIGRDDDGWLSGLFSDYLSAKQDWYRQILDRLDAGGSVDAAFAPIRAFQEERRQQLRAGGRFTREGLQLWKTQAAADAARWRRMFKDDELPGLLRQAIRLEPFVIYPRRPI